MSKLNHWIDYTVPIQLAMYICITGNVSSNSIQVIIMHTKDYKVYNNNDNINIASQ